MFVLRWVIEREIRGIQNDMFVDINIIGGIATWGGDEKETRVGRCRDKEHRDTGATSGRHRKRDRRMSSCGEIKKSPLFLARGVEG